MEVLDTKRKMHLSLVAPDHIKYWFTIGLGVCILYSSVGYKTKCNYELRLSKKLNKEQFAMLPLHFFHCVTIGHKFSWFAELLRM